MVQVACTGNPELTTIINNTGQTITITSIGSLYRPRQNEPFRRGQQVAAGSRFTYQTGENAVTNVLARQEIYNDDRLAEEGVRVETSVGTVVQRCR